MAKILQPKLLYYRASCCVYSSGASHAETFPIKFAECAPLVSRFKAHSIYSRKLYLLLFSQPMVRCPVLQSADELLKCAQKSSNSHHKYGDRIYNCTDQLNFLLIYTEKAAG
jgi:hypothetical protein